MNIYIPSLLGEFATLIQQMNQFGISFNLIRFHASRLLLLFSTQGLLTFLDIKLVAQLGERLSFKLKKDLLIRILDQDMSFFDARMQGDILARLSTDVSEFKHAFKISITQGLKSITQILGTAVHLTYISPSLTGSLVALTPILYFSLSSYGSFLRYISSKARFSEGEANNIAGESISNIKTVKSFAAESMQLQSYLDAARQTAKWNEKLGYHIGIFQGLTNASVGFVTLSILFLGSRLVERNELSPGKLMAYLVATQSIQKSFTTFGALFGQVTKAFGSGARIFSFMDIAPLIPNSGGKILPELKGDFCN